MRAYREFLTVDDPSRLILEPRVGLKKGQRVELVLMIDDEAELKVADKIADSAGYSPRAKRTLVREGGRLVAGAFPGERAITNDEVHQQLNAMEW